MYLISNLTRPALSLLSGRYSQSCELRTLNSYVNWFWAHLLAFIDLQRLFFYPSLPSVFFFLFLYSMIFVPKIFHFSFDSSLQKTFQSNASCSLATRLPGPSFRQTDRFKEEWNNCWLGSRCHSIAIDKLSRIFCVMQGCRAWNTDTEHRSECETTGDKDNINQ